MVVGDIDRGGVLAAMFGTLAILDPEDQVHVRAWIINKFRGDLDLLRRGLQMLEDRTDRPVLGVLPFLHDVWLDSEDGLATAGWSSQGARHGGERLTVAVVRLPRASNTTDVDVRAGGRCRRHDRPAGRPGRRPVRPARHQGDPLGPPVGS